MFLSKCQLIDVNKEHFQEGFGTFLQVLNINCNGFSILVKNENGDVAIDTQLNLFKVGGVGERGRIYVMEKVVLKIKLTLVEYRRDSNVGIYK